jgi:hypothetical protein
MNVRKIELGDMDWTNWFSTGYKGGFCEGRDQLSCSIKEEIY